MEGYRDAHVEPDWILIYKLTDNFYDLRELELTRRYLGKARFHEICKPCADRLA